MAKIDIARMKVGVDFDVNRNDLTELKKELSILRGTLNKKVDSNGLTKSLEETIKAADQLETLLNKSWNSKLGQIDLTKLNTGLKATFGTANNLKKTFSEYPQIYSQFERKVLESNIQLKESNKLLDKMAITMGNTIRFGISSSIFNTMTGSLSNAYNYVKKLDKSLNDIRIVSGQTADQMERFAKQANTAAKNLGSTTLDYTNAALIYYQQGLPEDQIKERTDITIKMANALGSDAQQVSDYMTAIWNNFADGSKSLEYYADVITKLGAATASSAEEIAGGLEKFAAVGQTIGLSYEYATAALTTITAQTRQSEDVVGTALKTIFSRIQGLSLGETLEDNTDLNKYSAALKAVGINIKDSNGELKDMDVILNEMGAKWKTLAKDQQVALAETVAGVRQYNQLVALMDNWDFMQENLRTAAEATGELNNQQEIYLDSVDAHLQKLSAEAEKTYATLFDEDAIKSFADAATGALSVLNSYLTGLGGGLNSIATIGLQATNIFSKQIASGIEQGIENKRVEQRNSEDIKQDIINQHSSQGEKLNNDFAVEEEIEIASKILEIRENLTEEEANQLIEQQKQVGLLTDQIKNYEKIDKNIQNVVKKFNLENDTLEDINNELTDTQDKIKRVKSAIQNIDDSPETRKEALDLLEKEGIVLQENQTAEQALLNFQTQLKDNEKELIQAKKDAEFLNEQDIDVLTAQRDAIKGSVDETYRRKLAEQEIQTVIKGTTTILSSIASIGGIVKTISNEDLSNWEKFKSIASVIALQGVNIVKNWESVKKTLQFAGDAQKVQALAVSLGFLDAAEVSATASAGAMWTAILGPIALVIAGITAVGVAIYALVKAYNADADAAKEAAEAANILTDRYNECKQAAEALQQSVSEYEDAKKALDELTEDAEGYAKALEKANENAKKLIEEYKLFDKYTIKNGVITIDPDALQEMQDKANQNLSKVESSMYGAKIASNQANLKSQNTDLRRSIGSVVGTGTYDSDTGREITRQFNAEEIQAVGDAMSSFEIDLSKDSEALKQELLSRSEIPQSVKDNIDAIVDNKEKLQEFATSISEATEANKFYSEQIMGNLVKEKYGDKIQGMAKTTNELGEEERNLAREAQINAIATKWAESDTNSMNKELKNIDVGKASSNNALNNNFGYEISNDEDLAKTYAKEVLGYDLSKSEMTYKGGWNKGTVKDKSGKEIVSGVSDDIMRHELARVAKEKEIKDKYSDQLDQTALLDNLDTAMTGMRTLGSKYGTDFTDAFLNAATSKGNEIDLTSLYPSLNPDEVKELEGMDGQDWLDAMGLDEDQLKAMGFSSAEDFAKEFKEGLENYEWDAGKAVENAISPKDQKAAESAGLDLDDYKQYSEHLMDVAESSDLVADSLKYDAEAATIVAKSVMRMNKGIEKLHDNQEDWIDVLKNSNKSSEEYCDALNDMRDAFGDLLDLSEEQEKYLDGDFFTKHSKLIKQAAEGDEKAIDSLRNALGKEIVAKIMVENGLSEADQKTIMANFEALQASIPDIKVGATIDTENLSQDEEAFMNSLQDMITATGMTVDQINDLCSAMGFEPTFALEEKTVTSEKPVTMTRTVDAGSYKDEDGNRWLQQKTYSYIDGYTPVEEKIQVPALSSDGTPTVKSITKKGTGSLNNFSKTNSGGSPVGGKKNGGGGGSKKTKNKDESKADRYQEVNKKLEMTSTLLSRLQDQEDKLLGKDLISNLNQQLDKLNSEIDLTKQKLKIAQGEQNEYANKLKNYGIKFNTDGSINQQSYANAFNAEQNRYNNAYTDDEAAKKRWEDFKEFISNYNELISTIDGLKDDIQKDLDKQLEINIRKFTLELEVRLNIKEASIKFNEFKRKIIDELSDDDIAGAVQQAFDNIKSVYSSKVIEELIEKINKEISEIGNPKIYGDNATKLLENLQEHYETLMDILIELDDYEQEIIDGYVDMLDHVSEEMDDQLSTYEQISSIIEHDMKLIQLTQGENAYDELKSYYERQTKVLNDSIDMRRRDMEFFAQQMATLEEEGRKDTEAWKNAEEAWKQATLDWQSAIEDAIEKLQEKLLNAINATFEKINEKLTKNKGLEYLDQEWELINKNADKYLDSLNAAYGVQQLQNKYLDAINDNDSVLQQQKLQGLMNDELKALREKDKLSQYDLDRADLRYQIALKQIALEDAQQNKSKMRLRRDSQGNYSYQYTADDDQIAKTQQEISDLYNQLYNLDKNKYSDSLREIYDVWNEYQEKMAEAAQINDPEKRAERELLIQEQYGELLNNLAAENEELKFNLQESTFSELFDLYSINQDNYESMTDNQQRILDAFFNDETDLQGAAYNNLFNLYDENVDRFRTMTEEERNILIGEMVPAWNSGIQEMVDTVVNDEGGFVPVMDRAFEEIKQATDDYKVDLDNLAESAGINFETIKNGIDSNIEATEKLLGDNKDLLDSYDKEVEAIGKVWDALDKLKLQYKQLAEEAKKAAEEGYKALNIKNEKTANEYAKDEVNSAKPTPTPTPAVTPVTPAPASAPATPSAPSLTRGSYVRVKSGVRWYADSYGGGSSGPARNGSIRYINTRGSHPYNIDGLGWVRKTDIQGYRTGGYTGDWSGQDGRLAFLHQKELILNENDTKNMLAAVSILRDFNNDMLNRLSATGLGGLTGSKLEQNVHIDATFPNVTSANEIENALNNLVNVASQRINR